MLQLLEALELLQLIPTPLLRNPSSLRAGFLGHLQKQQVRQLGDVLVIGDPVVLQDVAEVPQLGNDVSGGLAAHGCLLISPSDRFRPPRPRAGTAPALHQAPH